MRRLLYILILSVGFLSANAQTQAVTPIQIADASMLPNLTPTMGVVRTKRVYGADLQFEYYWKSGAPTGTRTQEYITKHYVVLGTTPQGGYWTTTKIFIDGENVLNLDSILKVRGFNYGPGLQNRIVSDSTRLQAEVVRAQGAEGNLQPKGTYLTGEADPVYTGNGVPKTRTINGYPLSANVSLMQSDVGLGSVNNTSDAGKPVSTAQQAALDLKESLSNKQASYSPANTSTTQYPSMAVLQAALSGYIKGVQFGGGVAAFTVPITLLGGGTATVTIPLNTTFTDTNYSLSSPLILGSGGLSLLGGTFTMVSITKNLSSVAIVLKNNAALSVAVNGTAEVTALKVIQ